MTDWRAAGRLADAHRVTTLARREFDSADKALSRTSALQLLARHASGPVLDLWGGGISAEEGAKLGLDVLSVDDGRWLKSGFGVSSSRVQRAIRADASEKGYRAAFGPAKRFAAECSAAFYDFCGHWCPQVRQTLEASRHMNAIVVTLMPERVAVGRSLTVEEWRAIYASLLRMALPHHRINRFRQYRRREGHHVFVFSLILSDHPTIARLSPEFRARHAAYARERYATDPEYRVSNTKRARDWERRVTATPEGRALYNLQRLETKRKREAKETPDEREARIATRRERDRQRDRQRRPRKNQAAA